MEGDEAAGAVDGAADPAASGTPLLPAHFGERFTGDLSPMRERKVVRALVSINKTDFFFEKGRPLGLQAEALHQFEEFLDAAERLRDEAPEVLFAVVGGGPRRAEIETAKRERQLDNLELLDYFPREALARSLSAADIHFMSLRPEQTGVAVPGKLQGILAAGRPVLFVGAERCESADTIRDADAGRTFVPGQSNELADAILALAADESERRRLGQSARAAFLTHFERAVACEQWRRLLEEVAGESVEVPASEAARAA